MAKLGDEQAIILHGSVDYFFDLIRRRYNVEFEYCSAEYLINKFAGLVDGYILCRYREESINIATALCSPLRAVAVTEEHEQFLKDCGMKMLLDVRGKTDEWLRSTSYFKHFNKQIAVNCDFYRPQLRDYAVMTGAYVYSNCEIKTLEQHKEVLSFLDDNALVFGRFVINEWACVKSLSQINASFFVTYAAHNLSTLSGFRLERLKQKTVHPAVEQKNKCHTVCLMLTDGDNIQYLLHNFATVGGRWFGASRHTNESTNFPFAWGLPPALIDIAAPTAEYFYENMQAKDEFVMHISGCAYTFPSQWPNKDALQRMTTMLSELMERMDMRIAVLIDDYACDENTAKDTYSLYTEKDSIDALFYMNYAGYARYRGKILWSNNKPVISARWALWEGYSWYDDTTDCDGSIEAVADKINSASRDPSSPEAYSFIPVFAWQGMKDGKVEKGGNTYDYAYELIKLLDDDVDVVLPSEFVRRIKENCAGLKE